ncbi:MAG TPA: hypothetical protein PK752_24320 [Accumulibacter sp.]|uniref:hypothetical protein n=1 Tax=Accumulibacter sp. TaxID=2053492 RepID=UPI002BB7111F|nr:hypothetical protein [Accumulibacter sp.]HRD91356.1 hypothetical protein [Accumulibacter sp.]
MHAQRGRDRRQQQSGPPPGMAERRCGVERRTLHVTPESIAEMEARVATLARNPKSPDTADGSGWDKLIVPLD